jgi:hypothetical protein
MSVPSVDPSLEGADDVVGPEVALCLSCWTPKGPCEDWCGACGAPVSGMPTAGAYETIWAWAWALEVAGRWEWTRCVTLLAAWSYLSFNLFMVFCPLDSPWVMRPYAWSDAVLLASVLCWLTVLVLVVRYVTLRWLRLKDAPDPSAPDHIQPDVA